MTAKEAGRTAIGFGCTAAVDAAARLDHDLMCPRGLDLPDGGMFARTVSIDQLACGGWACSVAVVWVVPRGRDR